MTAEPEDIASPEDDLAEEARKWVVRLASGAMTDADLAALHAWLGESARHAEAFEAERAFWQRLGPLQETFERLEREQAPAAVVPLRPRRRIRAFGAAVAALAACLLALAFAPDLLTVLRADLRSGGDGILVTALPDGSRVTLDRNSAVALDFDAGERRVEVLEGEAFFEVEPDAARPFRVVAAGGVSQAVGTAYAVRLDRRGGRVAVTEGRVVVRSETAEAERALGAGQALRYTGAGVLGAARPFDVGRALAWRQSRVVLVGRPLPEALAELQRYHPGRILLLAEDRATAPVTGVVDLDRLDDGIAALAATHGLTVHHVTRYLTVLR